MKAGLSQRHIANASLLLNRAALLKAFGQGGIAAEFGVDRGEFSKQILDATNPTRLHLVDVWHTPRYHKGLKEQVTKRFQREIAAGRVVLHESLSVQSAAGFQDAYFDWIYIDTDHSYATTRDELAALSPKMKPHGILAGHDYCEGNWSNGYRYGVIEAVHEFCIRNDWELLHLTVNQEESPSFAIRRILQSADAGARLQ